MAHRNAQLTVHGRRCLSPERANALRDWIYTYKRHRTHTAIGGRSPISRVNNGSGSYS